MGHGRSATKHHDIDDDHDFDSELTSPDGYWVRSQMPLQCLLFLLPLVFFYELGVLLFATDFDKGVTQHIEARLKLNRFSEWMGLEVPPLFLPGLIIIVVLLAWHIIRRAPWSAKLNVCAYMLAEGVALALPMFVFALVLRQNPAMNIALPMLAGDIDESGWKAGLVFSIGAGLYEELLFRLIGVAMFYSICVHVLALPKRWSCFIAISVSAILFSWYHFHSLSEFNFGDFMFYAAAGLYLGYIFMLRGFGIVVAAHAMYDVMVVTLRALQH